MHEPYLCECCHSRTLYKLAPHLPISYTYVVTMLPTAQALLVDNIVMASQDSAHAQLNLTAFSNHELYPHAISIVAWMKGMHLRCTCLTRLNN